VELARVLGMEVVAEGIETQEQYALLRQLGCRFGQGFLFSRPVTADAISEMLRLPGRILPELAETKTVPVECAVEPHQQENPEMEMATNLS
jgi:predicted signal transduction protein with EAL and GGDEF domain